MSGMSAAIGWVEGSWSQEVGPAGPGGAALDDQAAAQARLAFTGPEVRCHGRPALRVEPAGLGQQFHDGGLPGTVLAHQHGEAGGQVQALAQHLLHGRDRRGPSGGIHRGARLIADVPDRATVPCPSRTAAADHATIMPRPPDVTGNRTASIRSAA
jgi:hypothetical protein